VNDGGHSISKRKARSTPLSSPHWSSRAHIGYAHGMIYRIVLTAIALLFASVGTMTVLAAEREWVETGEEFRKSNPQLLKDTAEANERQRNQPKLTLSKWISQAKWAYAPSVRLAAVQVLRRLAENYRDEVTALTNRELSQLRKGLAALLRTSRSVAIRTHAEAGLNAIHES